MRFRQRVADWRLTPARRATSAGHTPCSSSAAASRRRDSIAARSISPCSYLTALPGPRVLFKSQLSGDSRQFRPTHAADFLGIAYTRPNQPPELIVLTFRPVLLLLHAAPPDFLACSSASRRGTSAAVIG